MQKMHVLRLGCKFFKKFIEMVNITNELMMDSL